MNLQVPSNGPPSYQRAISKAKSKRAAHKIVLLGSERCGKSALVNRFLTNEFTEKYSPTIEECYEINYEYKCNNPNHNHHNHQQTNRKDEDKKMKKKSDTINIESNKTCYALNLDIIDMCAPFTFPVMREFNVNTSSVILILYQVGNLDSVQEAIAAFNTLDPSKNLKQSVVLVGTKYDLYPRDIRQEEYEESDELYRMLPVANAGHVLTSAKLNFGVKDVFDQGIDWHVKNKHSSSLINDDDVVEFDVEKLKKQKKKKKKCVIM